MTDYALRIHWNPNSMQKIGNEDYPLEPVLHEKDGTAWNVVALPGVNGGDGFQGGDTIHFAFMTPGSEQLTSATIYFQKEGGTPLGVDGNPIGMQGGNTNTTTDVWSLSCSQQDFHLGAGGEQVFQDSQPAWDFTFAGGNNTWIVAVEAVYSVGATDKTFRFDPEWKVGSGGG